MKNNQFMEAVIRYSADLEELLKILFVRKDATVYKSILTEVEGKIGKKITGYNILKNPRISSNDLEAIQKFIKNYKKTPPSFILITFEDESQIGVLHGREIIAADVYLNLQKKIKEAVKNSILKSSYPITNNEIDEIVPAFLNSGINLETGQPYLSNVEKRLLNVIYKSYRAKIFSIIARLVHNKEIGYIDDPVRGRLYTSPKDTS